MCSTETLKCGKDLSELTDEEINQILLPIPSDNVLSSQETIMSIPSEGELSNDASEPSLSCPEGFIMATAIRERIANSVVNSVGHGELDTKKLTEKLEALAIPQDLLDDRTPPEVSPATTPPANDMGKKVKGFFNELSSMWAFPDADESSDEEKGTDRSAVPVSKEWDFHNVEVGVTSFFNKAIEKGTNWIESSASELANSMFPEEKAGEVGTKPTEDFYEFNEYKIRTKGFGGLTLQKMKLADDSASGLVFTFKIEQKPGCVVTKSVVDNSLLINYGKDVVEITVPETKDPKHINVRDVLKDLLVVETD